MKNILSLLFAFLLLVAVSSCTDPNADELYDLKKETTGTTGGEVNGEVEDNPPR